MHLPKFSLLLSLGCVVSVSVEWTWKVCLAHRGTKMMKFVWWVQLLRLGLRNLVHALALQVVAADLRLTLPTLVLTCRHVLQTLRLTCSAATWRSFSDGWILLNSVHCLLLRVGVRRRLVAHQPILHIAAAFMMQTMRASAVVLNLACLAQRLLRLLVLSGLRLLLVVLRLRQKGKVLRTQHIVAALIWPRLICCATHCLVLLVNALELRVE